MGMPVGVHAYGLAQRHLIQGERDRRVRGETAQGNGRYTQIRCVASRTDAKSLGIRKRKVITSIDVVQNSLLHAPTLWRSADLLMKWMRYRMGRQQLCNVDVATANHIVNVLMSVLTLSSNHVLPLGVSCIFSAALKGASRQVPVTLELEGPNV